MRWRRCVPIGVGTHLGGPRVWPCMLAGVGGMPSSIAVDRTKLNQNPTVGLTAQIKVGNQKIQDMDTGSGKTNKSSRAVNLE